MSQLMIQLIPVENIPIVKTEDELWENLLREVKKVGKDGDILVSAHTPWSRVRGPIYKLSEMTPSERAKEIAKISEKPPEKVEVVLQESREVIKVARNIIVSENSAGIICANAGVDESNAGIGQAIGVPKDTDGLAREIRRRVKEECGISVAVIISDTVGRALRIGAVNIAIGVAGIRPIYSEIGKVDLFGYTMRFSEIAIADEIASAAELIQGETDEAKPVVLVRGYKYESMDNVSARVLNRPSEYRLFK